MTLGVCPFVEDLTGAMFTTTYAKGGGAKVGFCDHTAGGFYRTLRDVNFWRGQGYSVHFAVARDGRACQLVNIFDRAWGQGRLGPQVIWPPYETMGRVSPNEYLISTEHEDAETVNGITRFVPDAEWTPEQYAMDLRIKQWCIAEMASQGVDLMRFGIDSLAGHYMFDGVSRANCPGPAWKREYRERLYADLTGAQEEDDMMTEHDAWGLAGFEVPAGQRVTVNAQQEFGIPAQAKRIHLEVLSERGYAVILNGSGSQSGRVGWARAGNIADGYEHSDVFLAPDGTFQIWAEDQANPPRFYTAHVTSWA